MPPQNNNNDIIAVRKKLAKEYCRSILWLDDEIRPDADGLQKQKFLNFFVRIADEFSKQHILCQLKGFPQINEEGDPYADAQSAVSVCTELARKADILLLDWHLGANNPTQSKKILRELISDGGNRFVIILSQEPQLKTQFEQEFSDDFSLGEEWYRHKNGLFVLLLTKASFETPGIGNSLIDKIYDQLAVSYPDYLHWAAIETAGRIKALAHTWLNSLPVATDVAILAEKIHSGESVEEAILENLLDDLKETITLNAISSLNPDNLNIQKWSKFTECQKSVSDDLQLIVDINHRRSYEELHPVTAKEALKDPKRFKRVLEKHSELASVKQLKASVEALGAFSEIVSVPRKTDSPVRPGTIFQSNADGSKILVCISQGCDCIRATNLLFLQGQEDLVGNGESGDTFLQFKDKNYLFKARAENLFSLKVGGTPRAIADWTQVGLLRQQTLTRLISRFWGYSTRVGINQPRFVRDSRKESAL
jgi:hypothetical protein